MPVDVRIQVQLQDLTAAGFQSMAANSRAAFASIESNASRLQATSARMKTAGQDLGVAGAFVSAPIIGAGIAAAQEAIAVESSMADVNKVLGKTEAAMAGVEEGLVKMSTRAKDAIPITVTGLADIAAAGGALGIPAKEILGFTEVTAKMATAFDMSANEAGEAIAKMRNVYSLDTKGGTAQVTELGDTINQLSNNMASKAPDIVEAMTRIGGVSRNFGLAKEETAALAASIIALGNAPELASTAINNILPALQGATGQTKKFKAGLAMAGISAEQMGALVQKDGVGAINHLLTRLNKLEPQARTLAIQKMFGAGIDARVLATLSNDAGQFSKALALVGDRSKVAGSMQREFATRSATTANSMVILKNNLTAVSITLGKIILPMVNQTVGAINPILSGVTAFAQAHPNLTRLAVAGLAVVAALGGLLVVAGGLIFFAGTAISAIATIGGAVGFVVAAVTGGAAALGLFFSAASTAVAAVGGIGVVAAAVGAIAFPVAAVVGLAVGAFMVIRNWRQVSSFFSGLWARVVTGSKAAWSGLVAGGKTAIAGVSAVLSPIAAVITAPLRFGIGLWVGIFKGLGSVLAPPVTAAAVFIGGKVSAAYNAIMGSIQRMIASGASIAVAIFSPIGAAVGGAISIVQTRVAMAKGIVIGVIAVVGGKLNSLVVVVQGVAGKVGAAVAVVVAKFQAIAASVANAQNTGQRFGVVVGQALGQVVIGVIRLGGQFFNAGANLITQLIQGIRSKVGEITSTIAGVATQVRAYLPFSPAKVGALSDLHKVNILGTVSATVRQQAAPLANTVGGAMQMVSGKITPAIGGAMQMASGKITPETGGGLTGISAPRLSPPTNGGGSITLNYSPVITLPGGGAPTSEQTATFREELARNRDEIARIVESINRNRSRIAYS